MESPSGPGLSTAEVQRGPAPLAAPIMLAHGLLVVIIAGTSCSHAPAAGRPIAQPSIAWPSDASVIEVVPVTDPGEIVAARQAHPFRIITSDRSPRIRVAFETLHVEESSIPEVPIPKEMADVFPGIWDDGVEVPWDMESCLLGGHVETSAGGQLDVEGGLCFNIETRTWRIVRLRMLPTQLRPSSICTMERICQGVMIGDERAVTCSHRPFGLPMCGRPLPGTSFEATYRFVGLH